MGSPAQDAYIFEERIYNADGNVVEERAPVADVASETFAGAYSEYEYDESVPFDGADFVEEPLFFTRRQNVLSVTHHADGDGVLAQAGSSGAGLMSVESRSSEFTYEPIFNEVIRSVRSVTEEQAASATPLYETIYDFDHWDAAAEAYVDGTAGVLNSLTRKSLEASAPDRTFSFTWTPNGALASSTTPQGKSTSYSYYPSERDNSTGDFFGGSSPPTNASSDNQGLLASVEVEQFDADYSLNADPSTDSLLAGSPIAGELGSPKNPNYGPYAWLAADQAELEDLGLSSKTIEHIVGVAAEPTDTTEISYHETGYPHYVWQNGSQSRTERDSEGRVVEYESPNGNITTVLYSVNGWATQQERVDAGGEVIGQTKWYRDDVGRILAECVALESNGCDGILAGDAPELGAVADPGRADDESPAAQLRVYRYTDAGLLRAESDPAGLITEYNHDSRGHVIAAKSYGLDSPTEQRKVSYVYDAVGNRTGTYWGTLNGANSALGVLSTELEYDGFYQLSQVTDTRGEDWKYLHDTHGRRVSVEHLGSGLTREAGFRPHGELEFESVNGGSTYKKSYWHTEDGRLVGTTETGGGARVQTYDFQGRVVWSRDAEGNMGVTTYDLEPTAPGAAAIEATQAQVRVDPEGGWATTTSEEYFDEVGALTTRVTVGGEGSTQSESWVRDANSFATAYHNAEGLRTEYQNRNFAGWPATIEEPVDRLNTDTTQFVYDERGSVTRVTDAAGQQTRMDYNAFGDTSHLYKPGATQAATTYTYDGLGRLQVETRAADSSGPEQLEYVYDSVGDLTAELWTNAPSGIQGVPEMYGYPVLVDRTYDSFGRPSVTTRYNVGLVDEGFDAADVKVRREYDYDALERVTREAIQVGGGKLFQTDSLYSPSGTHSSYWTREVFYPVEPNATRANTQVDRYMDGAGRLGGIVGDLNGSPVDTVFDWVGGRYAGRTQKWTTGAGVSPLREEARFDDLVRRTGWTYTALDLVNGSPINQEWGDKYCRGVFDAADCSAPLLDIDIARDVMGRARSIA
ncbi:MAG: hypothetical protein ACOC9J_01815, partial [Persicimonas sp.]